MLCKLHILSLFLNSFKKYNKTHVRLSMHTIYMCHVARKPDFVVCKQEMCRSACTFTLSDQCLCFSLSEKKVSLFEAHMM